MQLEDTHERDRNCYFGSKTLNIRGDEVAKKYFGNIVCGIAIKIMNDRVKFALLVFNRLTSFRVKFK